MSDTPIQKIHSRFTRNIITIHGIVFSLIVVVTVSSTYVFKRELANQVTRTIEGKIKNGDTKEIITVLSDAITHDFATIEFYDKNDVLEMTLATSSQSKKWWRQLIQAEHKKKIFFDLENKSIAATIIFKFGVFQLLPLAILIFIIGLLMTYPLIARYKVLLTDNWEKETIKKQTESFAELARQVRHDYKSPLMAIKSVIDKAKNLTPLEKRTLSVAYNRMISMLGDLSKEKIQESLENKTKKEKEKALTHVYSSLLSVVEEKMAKQGESNPQGIIIKILCSDDDKRAYVSIDDVELQRVVSNLLENAIQSYKGFGEILLHIDVNEPNLNIIIEDNGKGIPEKIIPKIGRKGYSYGKKNGEGLGLYSAIKKIETWNGSLKIDSTENIGTQITITIPRASKPKWAGLEINLEGIEKVVVLDDDESIHQIWNEKLKEKSVILDNFIDAQKMMEKVDTFGSKTLFLLDHELRGQEKTGLDVAKELYRDNTCYLVTNSFQDHQLQRACERLGMGLIPKTII